MGSEDDVESLKRQLAEAEQEKVQAARYGLQVLEEKHAIGQYGWRAIIKDSEGNRIALHSTL